MSKTLPYYYLRDLPTMDKSLDHLKPHELFKHAESLLAGTPHLTEITLPHNGRTTRFFNYKGVVFQKGNYAD